MRKQTRGVGPMAKTRYATAGGHFDTFWWLGDIAMTEGEKKINTRNYNSDGQSDERFSCCYYYKLILLQCRGVKKKLQEHLTIEKNKTNDSITQVKNRSQTVRDQVSD